MIKSHLIRFVVLSLLIGLPQLSFAQVNELRLPEQGPFQLKTAENPCNVTNPAGLDPSSIEAANASAKTTYANNEIDFGRLITQLVVSTVMVLGLCFAILIVAKKFRLDSLFLKKADLTNNPATTNMILESTLRLGRCNTLHIVEAGGNRLAVGMDATGIKTIVPLQPVFSQQLESMQPAPETSPASDSTRNLPSVPIRQKIDLASPKRQRFEHYHGGFPKI